MLIIVKLLFHDGVRNDMRTHAPNVTVTVNRPDFSLDIESRTVEVHRDVRPSAECSPNLVKKLEGSAGIACALLTWRPNDVDPISEAGHVVHSWGGPPPLFSTPTPLPITQNTRSTERGLKSQPWFGRLWLLQTCEWSRFDSRKEWYFFLYLWLLIIMWLKR